MSRQCKNCQNLKFDKFIAIFVAFFTKNRSLCSPSMTPKMFTTSVCVFVVHLFLERMEKNSSTLPVCVCVLSTITVIQDVCFCSPRRQLNFLIKNTYCRLFSQEFFVRSVLKREHSPEISCIYLAPKSHILKRAVANQNSPKMGVACCKVAFLADGLSSDKVNRFTVYTAYYII